MATRAELLAEYQALRDKGMSVMEIAIRSGRSHKTVRGILNDPDGSKQRRRRKRYQGKCVDCGGPTDGSNGRTKASKRCASCAAKFQRETELVWSPEKIVEAIKEWAAEHDGMPPSATDWIGTVAGSPGQYIREPKKNWVGKRRYPAVSQVQREFGTWSAAIAAAGFKSPAVGQRRDPEAWLINLKAAHRQRHHFARDYGLLVSTGAHVGKEQIDAVVALDKEVPLSEHLRRALDLYIKENA